MHNFTYATNQTLLMIIIQKNAIFQAHYELISETAAPSSALCACVEYMHAAWTKECYSGVFWLCETFLFSYSSSSSNPDFASFHSFCYLVFNCTELAVDLNTYHNQPLGLSRRTEVRVTSWPQQASSSLLSSWP